MKPGDVVQPTKLSGFVLRCATQSYEDAVVISTEPFILTSRDSNMRWESTIKIEDFKVVGEVGEQTRIRCSRRLTLFNIK